jgi:putative transposase
MSKSRHTEAQMIGALKQVEAGRKAEDVAREVGVSKHTLYAWKAKYGGLDVSQAQEAKQLRDENTKLRKLVADLSLDKEGSAAVGDPKKRMELVALKAAIGQIGQDYACSERRACGLMTMAVSSYRYQSRRSDEPLRTRLVELAREKPRFGYRRLHVLLGRAGEHVNHKRLHRVYREAGLMIRRKKRKHCVRVGQPLLARTAANQEWALDFLHDAVGCGAGDPGAECSGCVYAGVFGLGSGYEFCQSESDAGIGCDRGRARAAHGDPLRQRAGTDQPAFSGVVCGATDRVDPHSAGKAYAERTGKSFHGRLREECLTVSWFQNLFDARRKIAAWRKEYNVERPHSGLGYQTPHEFAAAMRAAEAGSALMGPPSSAASPELKNVV